MITVPGWHLGGGLQQSCCAAKSPLLLGERQAHEKCCSSLLFGGPRCLPEDPWRVGYEITAWTPVPGGKGAMSVMQCLLSDPFPGFSCSAVYHRGLTVLVSTWFGQWRNWKEIGRQRSQEARVLFPLLCLTWEMFTAMAVPLVIPAYHSVFPSGILVSTGHPWFLRVLIPYSCFYSCSPRGDGSFLLLLT